jgi:hypothetical protein
MGMPRRDQDIVGALLVSCALKGCGAQPGEPCVNSIDGSPRDEPHWNRVVRGRRARSDWARTEQAP